jgi:hypothetical protein
MTTLRVYCGMIVEGRSCGVGGRIALGRTRDLEARWTRDDAARITAETAARSTNDSEPPVTTSPSRTVESLSLEGG